MENLRNKRLAGILPAYFRNVGLVVLLLTLVAAVIMGTRLLALPAAYDVFSRSIVMNGFILGLLFVALSREKNENEFTLMFKLKALNFSFIGAVLYVFVRPFTNLAIGYTGPDISAQALMLSMLFAYLFMYYFQKKVF